jgi:hypothetical protein
MSSTQTFVERPDGSVVQSCASGLGSYSLAYSTIRVKVYQDFGANNQPVSGASLFVTPPTPHPDPKQKYCLNFLESGFADDKVQVVWSGAGDANDASKPEATRSPNDLLALVVSKNIDRTGEIIRKLIRALFIALSRNPDSTFGRGLNDAVETRLMTEQDVNPFDVPAMARLNKSLKEYGICITLGKYTHSEMLSADAYCNSPDLSLSLSGLSRYAEVAQKQRYLVDKLPIGIFYRPKQSYSLFAYVRDDPDLGGPWHLRKVESVQLENISPVMVLGVSRALFAEHRVAFAFDNGNLVDFCLAKGSEVQGAVKIPVDIIYGIVSLPSATIEAELSLASGKKNLLDAQKRLIDAQNAYMEFLVNGGGNTAVKSEATVLTKDNSYLGFKAAGATDLNNSYSDIASNKFPDSFCQLVKDAN